MALSAAVAGVSPAAHAASPDPGPAAGINVNVVNTPLPVTGAVDVANFPSTQRVTGSVSVTQPTTAPLFEMVGLPMNFQTAQPLDTSSCSALRVVLRSPSGGPSLLLLLQTPVASNASAQTTYYSTLVSSGDQAGDVVQVPPPQTSIRMGISGNCPACALGIYCR